MVSQIHPSRHHVQMLFILFSNSKLSESSVHWSASHTYINLIPNLIHRSLSSTQTPCGINSLHSSIPSQRPGPNVSKSKFQLSLSLSLSNVHSIQDRDEVMSHRTKPACCAIIAAYYPRASKRAIFAGFYYYIHNYFTVFSIAICQFFSLYILRICVCYFLTMNRISFVFQIYVLLSLSGRVS